MITVMKLKMAKNHDQGLQTVLVQLTFKANSPWNL